MREILFRGKRKDNGEWVEGHLIQSPYMGEVRSWISTTRLITIATYYGDWRAVEVGTDTICQYTGLTDKNGNKIWENDIVKCYSIDVANRENEFISNVYWDDCMWCVHEKECCDNLLCYFDMSKNWGSHIPEIEVIGNTFDNHDLLKGE